MDESARKILISNLDRSRATLDSWLLVFTLLVVIGVVLEVVFVIWEYRDDLHDWRRGIVHPPERPSITLLAFGLFGAGLVAIGVSGELYIGARISAVETRIRDANDRRATLLSKLAGDAKVSAEKAEGAARRATDEADDMARQAAALSQYLAVAANLVNPRHLDRARFLQLMKGQPKAVAYIRYEQDKEAEILAKQLNLALGPQGLGWQTTVLAFSIVSVVGGPPRDDIQSLAASSGLAFAAKTVPDNLNSPLRALSNAIELSLGGWGKGAAMFQEIPTLPEYTFVIAVGRHVVNLPLFIPPKLKTDRSNTKP